MFLLDANTCIYALKGTYPKIKERFLSHGPSLIGIPAMVKSELFWGAIKSSSRDKVLAALEKFLKPLALIPFGDAEALVHARLRADAEKTGRALGPNDLIVAATVLAHNAILVTHHTREFSRIPGLTAEDWSV